MCGEQFNSRFVAYAKAHGHGPEEQLRLDDIEWQGGRMAGFSIWIMGKWDEYIRERLKNRPKPDGWTAAEWRALLVSWNHDEFDKWLEETQ
jgi:hypothetical protein